MTRAYNLYTRYTLDELSAMTQRIHNERPDPTQLYDGIYLFPKNIRKKLDDIAWAITWHMADARKEAS